MKTFIPNLNSTNSEPPAVMVRDLLLYVEKSKAFNLKLLTEQHHLERKLNHHAINRPGMNLFGFFKFFAYDRIQIFGKGEHKYLVELCRDSKLEYIEKFLSYEIPLVVFSHNNIPPKNFLALAGKYQVAVAISSFPTLKLIHNIHKFFDDSVSIKEIHYGVMMEIYGSGVLLQGPSGIGKSECALELLERGHRFVADDVVNIKRRKDDLLLAYPSPVLATHMEFKGIGIINVAHLFGVRSILKEKEIELVIYLENYNEAKEYDLIGLENQSLAILEVDVPMVTIPVKTASNIPILIETATMNERLKRTGYNTAKEFNKRIIKLTENKKHTSS